MDVGADMLEVEKRKMCVFHSKGTSQPHEAACGRGRDVHCFLVMFNPFRALPLSLEQKRKKNDPIKSSKLLSSDTSHAHT